MSTIEKVARAAFEALHREKDTWNVPNFQRSETGQMYEAQWLEDEYRIFARGYRIFLAATAEPTEAMIKVGSKIAYGWLDDETVTQIWRAMWAEMMRDGGE
jgi:hypothetical protein